VIAAGLAVVLSGAGFLAAVDHGRERAGSRNRGSRSWLRCYGPLGRGVVDAAAADRSATICAAWPLSKIDHFSVQQWVADLSRKAAPATVRECYRVLSLVLRSAVQAHLLSYNPCEGVRLPARQRLDEPVTLTEEEVTGKPFVEVAGRITPKPYPKSRAGRRTVPVPLPLVELLLRHLSEFPSPDLLFTNTSGGPVGRTSFRTRIWKPASGEPACLNGSGFTICGTRMRPGWCPKACRRTWFSGSWATRTLRRLGIYTDVPPDYVDRVDTVFDRRGGS
jgi:hypothetical protein